MYPIIYSTWPTTAIELRILYMKSYFFIITFTNNHFLQSQSLQFRDVMRELDFPGFVVNNAAALRLLVQAINCGMRAQEPFPVEVLYQPWKNSNGQVRISFIK